MPRVVGRFEKVSFEQFRKDALERLYNGVVNDEHESLIKIMYVDLRLARRATARSGGHDFYAPFEIFLKPGEEIVIPSGMKCFITDDYTLDLYPRSGHGFKFRLRLSNTVGIIDADYTDSKNEGHIMVKLVNEGSSTFICNKGDGFCQGIFHEFGIAKGNDEIETKRDGGEGSTDKKEN